MRHFEELLDRLWRTKIGLAFFVDDEALVWAIKTFGVELPLQMLDFLHLEEGALLSCFLLLLQQSETLALRADLVY